MTTYLDKPDDGLRLPLTRDPLASALQAFQTAQAAYLAEEALVNEAWQAGVQRKAKALEGLESVRDKAAVRVAVLVSERGGRV